MSVVVLGMHRSGTSAVTRAISLLGLPLCSPDHLLRGHHGNERGHWECAPMVTQNEHLLRLLSSRWWCPPATLREVSDLAQDKERLRKARATFLKSHPTPTWVWKDPRTCLLMPFWRTALPAAPLTVLVCRDPADVAASMMLRSHITPSFGLALWEQHLRYAVDGSDELPMLVLDYAAFVDNPLEACAELVDFCTRHGVPAALPADSAGLNAFVDTRLRHSNVDGTVRELVTSDQRELWDRLREHIEGGGTDAPPRLPPPGMETPKLLREVREAFGLEHGEPRPVGSSFVSSNGTRVLQPGGQRPSNNTRPRVSVLLLPNGGPATKAQVAALRPRLPNDAEIVTVTAADEPRAVPGSPGWFVAVHREHRMSLAQRINLAAEVANGEVLVVLAGPAVEPQPGWLPALRRALNGSDVAVACPALHSAEGGDPAYGLLPSSLLLSSDWVIDAPSGGPFPVPAASVAAMATTRKAFESVDGFDTGMTGEGSEDLDYCLRLWRSGWRCLAVPKAQVRMKFQTLPAEHVDLIVNALRLGTVHLDAPSLRQQLEALAPDDAFAEALSRVNASDAGRRRSVVGALSWYATAELPRSFGVQLLATSPVGAATEE